MQFGRLENIFLKIYKLKRTSKHLFCVLKSAKKHTAKFIDAKMIFFFIMEKWSSCKWRKYAQLFFSE